MTTITLDGVIFDRTLTHPLAYSRGLNWMDSISVGERAWLSGIACLMVDIQNLSKEFEFGAVIADFDAELAEVEGSRPAWKAYFREELVDTVFEVLPGLKSIEDPDRDHLDASLLLTIYGATCSRLSSNNRAHLIDAKVPGGKIAVLGEQRGTINRLKGLLSADVNRIGVDRVAAVALRTVETYTQMIENGDLVMSEDRADDIGVTMSHLKEGLAYSNSDNWTFNDESYLYRFDEIMEEFQQAAATSQLEARAA